MLGKRLFLTATLVFALGAASNAAANVVHFALSKSTPAADASVPAPEEVRLWFTQVPQENSVGVRLIAPSGDAVSTTEPTRDSEDPMVVFIEPEAPLAPGRYTVSWRGIGDDGHVVRGEFGFSVAAE